MIENKNFFDELKSWLTERSVSEWKSNRCLGEMIDEELRRMQLSGEYSASTLNRSKKNSFKKIKDFFGETHPPDLDRNSIELLKASMSESKRGFNILRIDLAVAYDRFVERGEVLSNEFRKVKPFKITKSPIYRLLAEQISDIKKHSTSTYFKNKSAADAFNDYVDFAYTTGARPTEILSLRKKDIVINEVEQIAFVTIGTKEHPSKNRMSRIVPVAGEGYAALMRRIQLLKRPDYYLFGNQKKRITVDSVSKTFKKIIRAINLPEHFTLYHLRHSYASNLINSNVPLGAISKILGHKSQVITEQRYAAFNLTDFSQVIQIIKSNSINNLSNQNLKEVV